jgi:hypothetical protein
MENDDAFPENRFPEPTEKQADFNAPSVPLKMQSKITTGADELHGDEEMSQTFDPKMHN